MKKGFNIIIALFLNWKENMRGIWFLIYNFSAKFGFLLLKVKNPILISIIPIGEWFN